MSIIADQLLKTRKRLNNILKENSGKPIEKIEKDTERDHWMDSKETLDYGLIDKILINKEKNKS